ncbi:MAG: ATP-binding protein [Verrucomicrobiota bacterium]|nr:ATP-binding protein [Verrucomicrobiota bacterium]
MPDSGTAQSASLDRDADFQRAFAESEREVRMQTGQLACLLVVLLMPAGVLLDTMLYPESLGRFFLYRLASVALVSVIWFLHRTEFGRKHYRFIQLFIVYIPCLFMTMMIWDSQRPDSPYYAGLNLVLLAISAVGHWPLLETVLSVAGVILMYLLFALARVLFTGVTEPSVTFGSNVYFLVVTGIIVTAGNIMYNRLAFREFTLRFELERNRKRLADALAELEKTNERLVELDRVKNRFFANISHELRTPLTLLLSPLETLLHGPQRSLNDTQAREWLNTMYVNGLRLLKLINDLLELVRLEAGKVDVVREPIDLEGFLRGLTSEVKQLSQDKRVRLFTLVSPDLGPVMADRGKLEKIVLNLLFNAIKFTPAGGRVEVSAKREGDQVLLSVSDTGVGIPRDKQQFIFSRFWQADSSSSRKYQGAGIGLALVKELVEAQGGTVSFESDVGIGTTFYVRLPFLRAEGIAAEPAQTPAAAATAGEPKTEAPQQDATAKWLADLYRRAELFPSIPPVRESVRPSEIPAAGPQPKVLIADDEPDMLRFLRSQLIGEYVVLEASDGEQAVSKAVQFLPDVVLCDMMMPEKDGLQVCRELRQNVVTQSIPILVFTARADEETKLAVLAAGASDFLAKPFSTSEVNVRVRNLIRGYRFQREVARQNKVLEQTIQQLKDTETQLVASEKMASLGRLSAGIMHEMNNPLNYIKTGLYVLRSKEKALPEHERAEFAETLRDIEEGIGRVQAIVSELRRFAHPHAGKEETIEVESLITSALRFVSHELKNSAKVRLELLPGHLIAGNRNKLLQVLINLLHNSVYAIQKKGYSNGEGEIEIASRTADNVDRIVVRDNGIGIEPEHLTKIFEPFFTTKDVGEGMGLGLSICYRILEEHGGRIVVRSEPGEFAEFTLELPRKQV